jgi:hypothetical protein
VKNLFTLIVVAGILLISYTPNSKAQDDCCGVGSIFSSLMQSGIFGGYGIQTFSAAGLNEVLPSEAGFKDYGTAMGWRVGANIIQLQRSQLLMGLKFYYQQMTETQDVTGQEIKLNLTQFNLGMSFSYIINNSFDIRIFDAMISWTNAELTNAVEGSDDRVYKSPETNTGFTFDAGIVYYPFPPYISLEVLGGYSIFSVEKVNLEEGQSGLSTINDIVDGGGFFAVAVLTVGIPFN